MEVTPEGIVMELRALQPENAASPITVTPSGSVQAVKQLQSWNAEAPMEVTPSGIATAVRAPQPENAASPITVTPSGSVRAVKQLQSWNAVAPMEVTPSGSVTEVRALQPENTPALMAITPSGIVIDVRDLQSANASPPIKATLSGSVSDSKVTQPANARAPMEVTPSGKTILRKLVFPAKASSGITVAAVVSVTSINFAVDIPLGKNGATNIVGAIPSNAPSPIEATLLGIVTEVKKLQPAKAFAVMDSIPSGITSVVKLSVEISASVGKWLAINVCTFTPLNAFVPTEVTLSGKVNVTNEVHPEKASLPIVITLEGIVTEVRLLQP